MMTEMRGASNAKAKRELGWQPRHPSWREGFAEAGRVTDAARRAARGAAPGGVRDRVPDARQRGRGGGRGPGGAAAAARRARARASGSSRRGRTWRRSPRGSSIDELRSARVRRETYVGEWLPEPLVTDRAADPARQAEIADSLSLAFLVLLESLSPEQRAVLLLHDVFDYGYARDRRDRRQERGQRPPARGPRAPARRGAPAALRGLARAARRAGAAVLRRRPGGRPRARSRRCSPTTSCCTATAAARRPALARAVHGRAARRADAARPGCGRARGSRGRRSARSRSTASPARCSSTARSA